MENSSNKQALCNQVVNVIERKSLDPIRISHTDMTNLSILLIVKHHQGTCECITDQELSNLVNKLKVTIYKPNTTLDKKLTRIDSFQDLFTKQETQQVIANHH